MKTRIVILIITTLYSISAFSEIMTEESEKAYFAQQNNRKLESLNNVPQVLKNYGNMIGCQFHINQENIVEVPENSRKLIALFTIDVGCSGGTAMSRPVFVELELSSYNMQYYLNMKRSAPNQTSSSVPQSVSEIYIKDGKVWYTAYEYDWSKDARCCPSIKNTAELKFENNNWVGIQEK